MLTTNSLNATEPAFLSENDTMAVRWSNTSTLIVVIAFSTLTLPVLYFLIKSVCAVCSKSRAEPEVVHRARQPSVNSVSMSPSVFTISNIVDEHDLPPTYDDAMGNSPPDNQSDRDYSEKV